MHSLSKCSLHLRAASWSAIAQFLTMYMVHSSSFAACGLCLVVKYRTDVRAAAKRRNIRRGFIAFLFVIMRNIIFDTITKIFFKKVHWSKLILGNHYPNYFFGSSNPENSFLRKILLFSLWLLSKKKHKKANYFGAQSKLSLIMGWLRKKLFISSIK